MQANEPLRDTLKSAVKNYESLVHELLREPPEENKIKSLMQLLGLPYTEEPIERLTTVLAFNPLAMKELT